MQATLTNKKSDEVYEGWLDLRLNSQRYALIEPYYIDLLGKETAEVLTEFYSKFCTIYEFGINLFIATIVDDFYTSSGYGLVLVGTNNSDVHNTYSRFVDIDLVKGKYEAERLANKIVRRVPKKMEVGYKWIY